MKVLVNVADACRVAAVNQGLGLRVYDVWKKGRHYPLYKTSDSPGGCFPHVRLTLLIHKYIHTYIHTDCEAPRIALQKPYGARQLPTCKCP